MANDEHLKILLQGVEEWNEWRVDRPDILPDLSRASLRGAFLFEANLSHVNLIEADLSKANLNAAILTGAQLNGAILNGASLFSADISSANLYSAILRGANLHRSNLRDANLGNVDFSRAHLEEANLTNAEIGLTTFANNNLGLVIGLETVRHRAASYISVDTLYTSKGRIPESFLRGAGVPDRVITYIPSLFEPAIQFYSCFISYSSKDHEFAERLYSDLQKVGVRCWFAPEDLKGGERWRSRIDESIRLYDKLLLIISENTVGSEWVKSELDAALERERELNRVLLFPIRLDDSLLEAGTDWAADILRTRHIADFKDWEDQPKYQKAISRLLRDLKASLATESYEEEQGR